MALLLAASKHENKTPYMFGTTGLRVFSLEEAFFHCRAHWKQTADDVFSPKFAAWVAEDLALPEKAKAIRRLAEAAGLRERLFGFLTLTGFYSEPELNDINKELLAWEKRANWEKLKERADELCAKQPKRALSLYNEALGSREGNSAAPILNNAGVAAMRLGRYDEAVRYFASGIRESPSPTLLINYIEALINKGDYEKADEMIRFAKAGTERAELHYLRGEIEYRRGKYLLSVPYYEQAALSASKSDNAGESRKKNAYCLRLADAYLKLRKFDKALETVRGAALTTTSLLKAAEVHAACQNAPAAVKCVREACAREADNPRLLAALCEYSRADYDLAGAEEAISKALAIAPDSPAVNFELARLKKAQGKIKEYQSCLRKTLSILKKSYRESNV